MTRTNGASATSRLLTHTGGALALAAGLAVVVTVPARGQVPQPTVPVPPPTLPVSLSPAASGVAQGGEPMVGTFRLTAGACGADVRGTYFRMIQPGGSAGSGPYLQTGDSPCSDQTYTPLRPGRDGGLTTGGFQPHPSPAFDGTGGGRADRITQPQRFFGVNFSTATNPTDPQTGVKVGAPSVRLDGGGRLSGDLRAFAAAWNTQHFNQGSPKPDGSTPGTTAGPTGTYDPASGAFTLEWTSQIVGGPFNNFTGRWHFEGIFSGSTATGAQPSAAVQGVSGGGAPGSRGAAATGVAGVGGAGEHPATGPALPVSVGVVALVVGAGGVLALRRLAPAASGEGSAHG